MPLLVRRLAENDGVPCDVVMIAHGGWFLEQHAHEPEVRFNILHGQYDFVVLQEHAHPFGPDEKFTGAVGRLAELIRKGGSVPVIYGCWARKDEPEKQEHMNEVHRRAAGEINALLAPVGEKWRTYAERHPDTEMYAADGAHASPAGSAFAASVIWETLKKSVSGE